MRKTLCMVAAAMLLLTLPTLNGHGADDKKLTELMKKKLEHAQKVLDGLTTNDFDKIIKNSDELMAISKLAEWKVVKTPQYELFSNDFRRNIENMTKESKKKNLDGATLAYVEMTLNCVRCHKYVREVRQTRLDDPSGENATRLAGR
jgi:hypothetical protein